MKFFLYVLMNETCIFWSLSIYLLKMLRMKSVKQIYNGSSHEFKVNLMVDTHKLSFLGLCSCVPFDETLCSCPSEYNISIPKLYLTYFMYGVSIIDLLMGLL